MKHEADDCRAGPMDEPAPATTLGLDWVGSPCGHHGTYTFYKAIKLTSSAVSNRAASSSQRRVLALGDFFFVKLWPEQDIISIGELQLLWEDDKAQQASASGNSSSASSTSSNCANHTATSTPLASLKLYFLPENTPDGRLEEHGEDEVISISEKVVIRVSDLAAWITDDVKWERGAPAVWERHCLTPPATPPADAGVASSLTDDQSATTLPVAESCLTTSRGSLDMRDVIKEKQSIGDLASSSSVIVLGYPAYCRYRSTLKRLEGHNHSEFMRQAVVEALGGRAAPGPNTRVVFCKSTFDYPELEDHELLCNHLAPKWKGRPRKAAKKTPMRSHSPGSESNESESSVSTITSSIKSKDSPLKNRVVPLTERSKGEQLFLQKLHKFMAGRGTPIGRLPSLGFKQLDLFSFYTKVQRAGGYDSAVANKQWKGIYIELGGHPSNTSAATCTRRHYEKLLLPYEQHNSSTGENPVAEAEKANEEAFSAEKDLSPSLASSSTAATPPKKRKLSATDPTDLPFEPTDEEESKGGVGGKSPAGERLRIVESCLPDEASPSPAKSPKIVESALPAIGSVIVRHSSPAAAPETDANGGEAAALPGVHNSSRSNGSSSSNSSSSPPASRVILRKDLTRDPAAAEVPSDAKERFRLLAESSNMSLTDLMGDPNILAAAAAAMAAAVDPKQAASNLSALGEMARAVQQQDTKKDANGKDVNKNGPEIAAKRPSVIQKTDPKTDPKQAKSNTAALGPPPSAHGQKPSHWYAQMIADVTRKSGTTPADPTSMLEKAFRPPTPLAATPSIFVSARRMYDDPAVDVKKARTAGAVANGAPAAHSRPTATVAPSSAKSQNVVLTTPTPPPSSRPSQPVLPIPQQQQPARPAAPVHQQQQPVQRPNNIPLVDLTSRNIKQQQQQQQQHQHPHQEHDKKPVVELNGKDKLHGMKPWSGNPAVNRDVSISLNVKIENEAKMAPLPLSSVGGSSQRHSVTVMPLVKEEKHKKESVRVPVQLQQAQQQQHHQQQQQQQQYPRMVDSLINSNPPKPASSSSFASTSNKSSASSSSSSIVPAGGGMPGYPGLLDPALASYYSSLYSHQMYGLPPNAFMGAGPGPGMFHPGVGHPHHPGMVPSSAAAEVTAQVYKDLVQRGYPPALAPGLPPGLSGLPGLSSLGSFASMYMGGGKEPSPGERSLPKS